ncbi:hypothetical protein DACRYDRAFT_113639 [Dacryopinax primogenitus]|uniref:Uncharacterized protein n=1 Tax=Dacryopinax primogenitus (strain DJM 731) TaxID=1858805 RepID=M5GAZ3_DACPD|nr:uncharacterized protein DACRYDRAFT_113639 [Dacryopinax primogenitus]EJU05560.1 hypothetical protein DACRYDRAFT_113639 [Dacryopinax primogenitus]
MRFLKYAKWILPAIIIWLSLAILYLTLPPGESIDDDVVFAQSLREGKSLNRVYHTEEFIPREYRLPRVRRRLYLGLEYSYSARTSTLRIKNEAVSLLPLLSPSSPAQSHSRLLIPWATLGDTDGVNPPWFPLADAVLLYGVVSREWGRILLTVERPLLPPNGTLDGELALQVVPARMATQSEGTEEDPVPLGMLPLATLFFTQPAEGEGYALARISFPPMPQSYGTSTYYGTRHALISLLAPSALLVLALASLAGQAVKLLLLGLGVAALLWIGRELWMYRHEQDEDRRERETQVLRKVLREVLGPLYAPRGRREVVRTGIEEGRDQKEQV